MDAVGNERGPSGGPLVAILGTRPRHAASHYTRDFNNLAVHVCARAFRYQYLWRIAHREQLDWNNVYWI